MACSKLTVGVHEKRAAASGAKTRVVAGFGWFGSDGVELDPRHISRWLQRFFPRVPSKAVRIKPIAVRVDLPETTQHPSSPCSGGSDAVPGTGENRHHHQQHRQPQEATPAAHSRVAQVQGVLAQHEAGLERYTGAEVSDALLLVDGVAAVFKDMGTASPRCYALAHCEEQRRALRVAARWVEVPRWILEITCALPPDAMILHAGQRAARHSGPRCVQTSPSATCKPSTALRYFDQHLCALGMAAMRGEFQPAVTVADAVVGELNSVHAPVRDEMRCVVVALAYQGSISTCRSGAWAPRCVSV